MIYLGKLIREIRINQNRKKERLKELHLWKKLKDNKLDKDVLFGTLYKIHRNNQAK